MKAKFKLEVTNSKDKKIVNSCERIALENNYMNGGTLRYSGLVKAADYIIYISQNDKVIAYASLNKNFLLKGDIYVMQVAVAKGYQNCGFGTKIYKYLIRHSQGFKYITSNVRKDNTASNALHQKCGFKIIGEMGADNVYGYKVRRLINTALKVTKSTDTMTY